MLQTYICPGSTLVSCVVQEVNESDAAANNLKSSNSSSQLQISSKTTSTLGTSRSSIGSESDSSAGSDPASSSSKNTTLSKYQELCRIRAQKKNADLQQKYLEGQGKDRTVCTKVTIEVS